MKLLLLILSVFSLQFTALSQPGKGTGDGIVSGKILDKSKDTDVYALANNFASIVPVQYDLTDYQLMDKIKL